jgi:hypothetical protein
MLVIPSDVLTQPGGLTDEEFAVMRTSSERGAALLARSPALADVAPIVRGHHERPDGRGYPDGPADVPLVVPLVSVSDAWDAMSNTRLYRQGMDLAPVLAIRRAGAGSSGGPMPSSCWAPRSPRVELPDRDVFASAGRDGRDGGVDDAVAPVLGCCCDVAIPEAGRRLAQPDRGPDDAPGTTPTPTPVAS